MPTQELRAPEQTAEATPSGFFAGTPEGVEAAFQRRQKIVDEEQTRQQAVQDTLDSAAAAQTDIDRMLAAITKSIGADNIAKTNVDAAKTNGDLEHITQNLNAAANNRFIDKDASFAFDVTPDGVFHLDTDPNVSPKEALLSAQLISLNAKAMNKGVTISGNDMQKAMYYWGLKGTENAPKINNMDEINAISPEILETARKQVEAYQASLNTAAAEANQELKIDVEIDPNTIPSQDIDLDALAQENDKPEEQVTTKDQVIGKGSIEESFSQDATPHLFGDGSYRLGEQLTASVDVDIPQELIPAADLDLDVLSQPENSIAETSPLNFSTSCDTCASGDCANCEASFNEAAATSEDPKAGLPLNLDGGIDVAALGNVPIVTAENGSPTDIAIAKAAGDARVNNPEIDAAENFGRPNVTAPNEDQLAQKLDNAVLKQGIVPKSMYADLTQHIQETGVATNKAISSFLEENGVPADRLAAVTKDAVRRINGEDFITLKQQGATYRREVSFKDDFTAAAAPAPLKLDASQRVDVEAPAKPAPLKLNDSQRVNQEAPTSKPLDDAIAADEFRFIEPEAPTDRPAPLKLLEDQRTDQGPPVQDSRIPKVSRQPQTPEQTAFTEAADPVSKESAPKPNFARRAANWVIQNW